MGKIIGVDIGNAYVKASYVDEAGIRCIPLAEDSSVSMPNVVYFKANGEVSVGWKAIREGAIDPDNMIQNYRWNLNDPNFIVELRGQTYSAKKILYFVIKELVMRAISFFDGETIDGVVVTCPLRGGEVERNSLKELFESIILEEGNKITVLDILDEPIAASLAYDNLRHQENYNKTVLVYDLGDYSFRCTVLKTLRNGSAYDVEVVTDSWMSDFGGYCWDDALTSYIIDEYCDITGHKYDDFMHNTTFSKWRFERNVERIKKQLSSDSYAEAIIEQNDGTEICVGITREIFERHTAPYLDWTIQIVEEMLEKKHINIMKDIDEIWMVGGATKMPQVRKKLEQEYNVPIISSMPESVIATGAALCGALRRENEKKLEQGKTNTIMEGRRMGKIIGIDLGTTNSCVSYVDEIGVPRIIDPSDGGGYTTPSVVFFDSNGKVVVGATARSEGLLNPECMVEGVKYYMGDFSYVLNINGQDYTPEDISYYIAKQLIRNSEDWLQEEIEGAVLSVPVYWGRPTCQRLVNALERIELRNGKKIKVLSVIAEPVAATLSFIDHIIEKSYKKLLVYDLGGRTFDCTILNVNSVEEKYDIKIERISGDNLLGGKDWDVRLADYVRNEFCSRTGQDPEEMMSDLESIQWFSENIEKVKKALSLKEKTYLIPSFNGMKEKIEISRDVFESETESLLETTVSIIDQMFEHQKINVETDIDAILLVGGSTYMPQVKTKLESKYRKPILAQSQDRVVAMGAAVYGNEMLYIGKRQKAQYSYGLEVMVNGKKQVLNLVTRGTELPACVSSDAYMYLSVGGKKSEVIDLDITVIKSANTERFFDIDGSVVAKAETSFSFVSGCYVNSMQSDTAISIALDIPDGRSGKEEKVILTRLKTNEKFEQEIKWKPVGYLR